ncbi:sulfotransferase family protein [Leptothoe spongobia]|uniref:Sulfotransferase domain-containing protein n=1 Tax=Leptothoe spongobia TAU-MAC 1115 TaxID=1967444 RepID=A0A947GK13_9CYAN|nr:sulfotransferase domain-containing protein [Leptothoe spongobia]MBT9317470.1 sulfotransferase domain-containing protein [Leptothoe spongobia TAU-MAC 1115]
MNDQKYILVTGNGRSGTNWVLDILNMSPLTHCRNEPHRISSSPFHITTKPCEIEQEIPAMANIWDHAASWTASTFGERDPYLVMPKNYIYPFSKSLGLPNLPLKLRNNKFVHPLISKRRPAEWKMPWWIGDNQKLRETYAVFKIINIDAINIIWLLENRPNVSVVHVVRHPGGRLNSWLTRFLSERDEDEIMKRNRSRLQKIKTMDKEWATTLSNIESMNIVETEVLLWRYFNEKLYQAGQGYKQYTCIVYEQVVQEPLSYAEKIYDFCNLPNDDRLKETIRQRLGQSVWGKLSGSSKSVAEAWKTKLSSENIEIVNRVLDESFMRSWWNT